MPSKINKTYSRVALLINSTNQEVTEEKMKAGFSALGLEKEFSSKIASMYCLPAEKFRNIISGIGTPSESAGKQHATEEAAVEEEPQKDESSSSDAVLDF